MCEKLAVIGVGNMAGAILGGVFASGVLKPEDVILYDNVAQKTEYLAQKGCHEAVSALEAASKAKYVLLSVKPQVLESVLNDIRPAVNADSVLISICAGISAGFIRNAIGFECRVVTVMPNTPLLVGSGATAVGRVEPISDEEFSFVMSLFSAAGRAFQIPANKMNEVIPLNGSSPAYIYYFTKLFVDEAEKNGFDRDTANELFCAALIGSAKMMLESGKSHDELISMVTSPGGTTLAGLEALKECGFEDSITSCSEATIRRARELGK